MIERIFQMLAVVLIGVAAYFLWAGEKDWGFVAAVLACVAFFLSIRFQVKARNAARAADAATVRAEDAAADTEERS